ncbi:ribonuclease H-like domain-containing protein [Tanacetum coccineum]|uniref:Ribonuclease H-like domain-containing protein n=1 Tax=Tanacetum coccineum TaxID=301880 RepID=A0ABQ4Y9I4_9ASTR
MLKRFDREDLDRLWSLVKKTFNTTDPTEDKEKELWAELKRLYEPDPRDQLWVLQRYMHDPLEWRLYDTCGVHRVSTKRGHEIFYASRERLFIEERRYGLGLILYRAPCAIKGVLRSKFGNNTNDNSSGALVNVKLIGCENYRVWATAMKISLQTRNKIGFVDRTCVKSTYVTSVLLSNQWERCLDDVYQPIRSSLLTQPELPDVKDAFVIVCREESHRGLGSTSGVQKPQVSSFVVDNNHKGQNRNNNRFNNNNNGTNRTQYNSFNNNNNWNNRTQYDSLSCKKCGMKGHTIDRRFEIIGYPTAFKKNSNGNFITNM